jgi:hypothetical protein
VLAPTGDRAIRACDAKAAKLEWEDAHAAWRVVARKPACKVAAVEFFAAVEAWSTTLGNAVLEAFGACDARTAEGEGTLFEAAATTRNAVATTHFATLDAVETALNATTATTLQALEACDDGHQKASENGAVQAGAELERDAGAAKANVENIGRAVQVLGLALRQLWPSCYFYWLAYCLADWHYVLLRCLSHCGFAR